MSNKGDPKITRTLLETVPVEGSDGWETRLYRITYPPGADGSGHSHPVPGVGYVLTGSIVSAFGEDKPQIFHAGQSFADAAHRACTPYRATRAPRIR
jgi:quercetin dioxygenase-like cupin family protein